MGLFQDTIMLQAHTPHAMEDDTAVGLFHHMIMLQAHTLHTVTVIGLLHHIITVQARHPKSIKDTVMFGECSTVQQHYLHSDFGVLSSFICAVNLLVLAAI